MSNCTKLISLFIFTFFIVYANERVKPDSNFKSIHQLELEQHQKDTTKSDTIEKIQELEKENIPSEETQVKAVINFSLLIVISVLLIITIAILLIVRSVYRAKRE